MMVAELDVQVFGLPDLSAKFESMTYDVRKKGGRAALRKAAQMVAGFAKQGAASFDDPTTSNSIEANIAVRWDGRLNKRTGNLGFRVGVLGGAASYANSAENRRKGRAGQSYATGGSKGNPGGDTWYWRFKEFGTSRIPATGFMRNALAEHIEEVTNEFIRHYDKALDRAIKRAKKSSST
jgi:HK97 gp10 family phage protein